MFALFSSVMIEAPGVHAAIGVELEEAGEILVAIGQLGPRLQRAELRADLVDLLRLAGLVDIGRQRRFSVSTRAWAASIFAWIAA